MGYVGLDVFSASSGVTARGLGGEVNCVFEY